MEQEPSMIDMLSEEELRAELKQVVEDVERKRKRIAELVSFIEEADYRDWRDHEKSKDLINKHKGE